MAKILVNAGQEQVPANSHWLLLWPQLTTVHSINSSMFLSPWSTFLPSVAFSSPVPLLHLCFSIIFFNIFFLNFYIIQAFMNLILLLQDPDQLFNFLLFLSDFRSSEELPFKGAIRFPWLFNIFHSYSFKNFSTSALNFEHEKLIPQEK